MTIAFQSERRRGLFVLQLARAGDYEAATTKKKETKEMWRFFKKSKTPLRAVVWQKVDFLEGIRGIRKNNF